MEERGNQRKHEEEEEEIVCLDASFFVDDNYKLTNFTFGSQDIELFCLHSASTDFDLTGQLVWPGAMLLNDYLSKNVKMLQDCTVIELGSGVGMYMSRGWSFVLRKWWVGLDNTSILAMLLIFNIQILKALKAYKPFLSYMGPLSYDLWVLSSRFCHKVVMTDHNEEVLKILKKNIELHSCPENISSISHELVAEKLEWGNTGHINEILQKHPGGFDLILGADIYILYQSSIPKLFDSVKQLLQAREGRKCKFILGYVSRAKTFPCPYVVPQIKFQFSSELIRQIQQIINVIAYLVCIAIDLFGLKYNLSLIKFPACSMDSLIIIEASKLRMKMKEVTGTRCIVGNLEGVVFEVTLE
ncbi:hypothetical protein ACSQ67_009772 [Phaseolus vulgaris]